MTYTDRKSRDQKVIAIEYIDGKPHAALTAYPLEKGGFSYTTWDIEISEGDIMLYNSGGGGQNTMEIPGDHFVKKAKAACWIARGWHYNPAPINCQILSDPLPLNEEGETNPFEIGEEVYELIYCSPCKKWYGDPCWQHMKDTSEGLKYFNNRPVQ